MKRSEAERLNLVRYKTGKPCKRGHFADRYTSTGACVECLNGAPDAPRKRVVPVFDWGFRVLRLRAHPLDAPMLIETAVNLSKRRDPRASEYYVCRRTGGTSPAGGTRLYVLEVHPDDVPVLKQMESIALDMRLAASRKVGLAPAIPVPPPYDPNELPFMVDTTTR